MQTENEWASELRARGLPASDAAELAALSLARGRHAGASRVPVAARPPRIPAGVWLAILFEVLEAQARGPRDPARLEAWRRLYEAGCPIDHIHRVLWHAFQDPQADTQDRAWIPPAQALANVDRYIGAGFPHVSAPEYGPGLGCDLLVRNALAARRRLFALRAPYPLLIRSLNRCRNALSPILRTYVDDAAGIRPVLRGDRHGAMPWEDELLAEETFGVHDHTRVDAAATSVGSVADVDDPVDAWFAALERSLDRGLIAHDVGCDRLVLADEPRARVPRRTRPAAAPVSPPPPDLDSLLAELHTTAPPWCPRPTVADLDVQDPLDWLEEVAELAWTAEGE